MVPEHPVLRFLCPLMCTILSKTWGLEPALRGARAGWKVCGTGGTLKVVAF